MPVLGTVLRDPISGQTFQWLQDSPELPYGSPSRFKLLLFITKLRSFIPLRQDDGPAQAIPKRHLTSMRCRRYPQGAGILTCFPFDCVRLGAVLGPTNPQLTIVAEEPWPFRRNGFSPFFAVTFGRIFISTGSTRAYARASAPAERPRTPSRFCVMSKVSVAGLSPVHFRRPRPRRVSCYAFFKGWLLLSLPPRCLGPRTSFTL